MASLITPRDWVKRPSWVPHPSKLAYGHKRVLSIDGGGIRGIIVGTQFLSPSYFEPFQKVLILLELNASSLIHIGSTRSFKDLEHDQQSVQSRT